ncbi:MAG: hypothetical protein P8R42_30485 [Candidatus Binatia bacterium]|nr:hypothetical protein [Candidatus Binatia bacterium]
MSPSLGRQGVEQSEHGLQSAEFEIDANARGRLAVPMRPGLCHRLSQGRDPVRTRTIVVYG